MTSSRPDALVSRSRAFVVACALALTACKQKPTAEQQAASKKFDEDQAKEKAAVKARLDSIATLEA